MVRRKAKDYDIIISQLDSILTSVNGAHTENVQTKANTKCGLPQPGLIPTPPCKISLVRRIAGFVETTALAALAAAVELAASAASAAVLLESVVKRRIQLSRYCSIIVTIEGTNLIDEECARMFSTIFECHMDYGVNRLATDLEWTPKEKLNKYTAINARLFGEFSRRCLE